MRTSDLPSFEAPPVSETLLGVEFAPLARWRIPHFGLFWHLIRDEYPRCDVKPSLAPQDEVFGEQSVPPLARRIQLEFLQQPEVRCWFQDSGESRLLQVQSDRFIHNWRKQPSLDVYPRYGQVRSRFETEWMRFQEFLAAEKLGPATVAQCEVTYVNHFERGREWASLSDLSKVVTFWNGTSATHPDPESVETVMSFVRGSTRLRVQLQHAMRRDLAEIVSFSLSARGRPGGGQPKHILQWMDEARSWIVNSFAELTTPAMHQLWKRRS